MNLVEAHVLDAIRREHEVTLEKVRRALIICSDNFLQDILWRISDSRPMVCISLSRNTES